MLKYRLDGLFREYLASKILRLLDREKKSEACLESASSIKQSLLSTNKFLLSYYSIAILISP